MRRTWAAGLLVAGLLAMAACGDDGGSADEADEPEEDVEATPTVPDLEAQLEAVRTAFDLTVDERTVLYDSHHSIPLPDGSAYFAASVGIRGALDHQVDRGSGSLVVRLLDADGGRVTVSTDVRQVDGIVWISNQDEWIGWTLDATTGSAGASGASWLVDATGVLVEIRDSIEEVVEHSPMVAGTDQWVVMATPPSAFGFVDTGPTEMTIKTRTGGVISTILYTFEVPADQLATMIAELADELGTASTLAVEVEVVVDAVDGALPSPVEQPCATPEPVSGPDGASLRCPAAG